MHEEGIKILKDRHDELNDRIVSRGGKGFGEYEPSIDEDGYISFQMWNFMEIFGNHINFGYKPPFDLDIIIDEKS